MENDQSKVKIGEMQTEALALPDQALRIQVVDDETEHQANEFLQLCRAMRNKIADLMDPNIKRWNEGHRQALSDKRGMDDPVKKAEDFVKPQVATYRRKKEEALRAAEEAVRLEIEKKKQEEEELLKKAAEAEEKGKVEEADELFEKAEEIAESGPGEASQALEETPKVKPSKGISIRKNWKYRVKNLRLIPLQWWMLDEAKIGAAVRSTQGRIEIPGIETYSEDSVGIKGK